MDKYNLRNGKREDVRSKTVKKEKSMKESSTSESLTEFLDLNDDCIDEIFSYFNYNDVLSALQVCIRFENRARDIFKRRKYTLEVICEKAIATPERLLRHVGPALLKLEMFFCEDEVQNQRTIDIVTKYCIANLTEITWHCLTKQIELRKSFVQVHKLTLIYCDMSVHFQFTKWFPNLTTLTHNYPMNLKRIIRQNVPTMHTLNINHVLSDEETTTMLLSNPQIKNLSLTFASNRVNVQRSFFTAIDEALQELQSFHLAAYPSCRYYPYEIPYQPLHFKHLKTLRIENYTDCPDYGLINHLAISPDNLERLQLCFSDPPDDPQSYDCITMYKNVRELQVKPFKHSLDVDVILMLINQLPLLERIEQTADLMTVLPWYVDEVAKFTCNSKQLMELAFIFFYEAKSEFNKSLNFIQTQFVGSKWMVKTEERHAPKVFETFGMDSQLEKQLVIRITKNSSS